MRVDHVSFRGLLLNRPPETGPTLEVTEHVLRTRFSIVLRCENRVFRPNDVAATFSLLGGLKTPLQGLDCSGLGWPEFF